MYQKKAFDVIEAMLCDDEVITQGARDHIKPADA